MPGKPSLGALLHIYSPRYVKSGPGDLPERPEKSPTLWGPLTRTAYLLSSDDLEKKSFTVSLPAKKIIQLEEKLHSAERLIQTQVLLT